MGISDLFVSYNQVQAPSYLESPQIEYTPIGEELTNQENLDRIQSRNQKKEGFAGWNPLEQNTSEDNSTNGSIKYSAFYRETSFSSTGRQGNSCRD